MQRRPPRPTRTDTLFPATTFCRSPGAVHSSRHGCIHQIISGCHIAEDAADHAGLFPGVHIAIAEGCCFTHALSSSQVLQPPQRLLSPFLMPELPEVETTIAGLRDRQSTRQNSSHSCPSRMPSPASKKNNRTTSRPQFQSQL